MQRVLTLEKDNDALSKRLDKSSSMLNSVALELFSDISTQTIDKDMLLTQYSRIKSLVADCNHISSEIGFPSTSVPEIVELLDSQMLQGMSGNTLVLEGVPRSIQSIALSLTLAECQILRSLNFLLKHLISENQKVAAQDSSNAQMSTETAGAKLIKSISKEMPIGASHQSDPALDDIIRQATLSSPLMSSEQLQHPNDVFRIEFQGSGVAVAKALVELRRRTASFYSERPGLITIHFSSVLLLIIQPCARWLQLCRTNCTLPVKRLKWSRDWGSVLISFPLRAKLALIT